MDLAFGSTCHSTGRLLLRQIAIQQQLNSKGIEFIAATKGTLVEEAPEAYKDVEKVVEACQKVGASNRVIRLIPIGVIKG